MFSSKSELNEVEKLSLPFITTKIIEQIWVISTFQSERAWSDMEKLLETAVYWPILKQSHTLDTHQNIYLCLKFRTQGKLEAPGYETHPAFWNPNKNVALLTGYSRRNLEGDGNWEIILFKLFI